MFGIAVDDTNAAAFLAQIAPVVKENNFAIYPENQTAIEVFLAVQTNWRMVAGFSGVVFQGIDYAALNAVFALMCIPKKDCAQLFQEIRLMETEAVPLLNKKLS